MWVDELGVTGSKWAVYFLPEMLNIISENNLFFIKCKESKRKGDDIRIERKHFINGMDYEWLL